MRFRAPTAALEQVGLKALAEWHARLRRFLEAMAMIGHDQTMI